MRRRRCCIQEDWIDRLFAIIFRVKSRETLKNCKCAAILSIFRQNPGVV